MSKFNVGDKVRVAADAGSANGVDNNSVLFGGEVEGEVVDVLGWGYNVEAPEVSNGSILTQYVGEEWLTLINEPEEKALEPMVVGGRYWNPGLECYYRVTSIDFEAQQVCFRIENGTELATTRYFDQIVVSFPGYCAPVKPETVVVTDSTDTVSIKALEEAADYLKAGDVLADLLKLAERLS